MRNAVIIALGATSLALLSSNPASASTVTVPSTATGCFGAPTTGCTAMVAAITVTGPGTITIKATGSVSYNSSYPSTGPYGGILPTPLNILSLSFPLDEAVGINTAAYPTKRVTHIGALMGAFVPSSVASQAGFLPVDGTRNLAPVGISPSDLFFVGARYSIVVSSAGTLFLGINDNNASDNSGDFTATAVTP